MLALLSLLLGLFPAISLLALQAMLAVVLLWLVLHVRLLRLANVRGKISWTHIALWQFFAFFLVNALVFAPLLGTPEYYQPVAIEMWSLSLIISVFFVLLLVLQDPARVKSALINWLPVGLGLTFAAATVVYFSGQQGPRIQLSTPNPLVPPLWFLMLTVVSFAWFDEMSRLQKAVRAILYVMAGLVIVYTASRLVMVAWFVSGVLLMMYLVLISSPAARRYVFLISLAVLLAALFLLAIIDWVSNGYLVLRFRLMFGSDLQSADLHERFARLVLWSNALSVAWQHLPFGAGAINERILLQNEIGWEHWLRAHQTYLSYLIAGGPLALVSGLLLQAPVLQFLRRDVVRNMFPVFVGLGVVLTLNCLTDSILQSGTAVQAYMVILLLFHHARAEVDVKKRV